MLELLRLVCTVISACCFVSYLFITFPYFHLKKCKKVKVASIIAIMISQFFLAITSPELISASGHFIAMYLTLYIIQNDC